MTAAQAEQWAAVERSATQNRCRCVLRPAMTATDLRTLGGGCTMPTYCCPTLDAYRRRVGALPLASFDAAPKPPKPPKKAHAARYDPFASQVTRG